MTQRERLKSLGINSFEELMKITGKGEILCMRVFKGKVVISLGMAIKIKASQGGTLDFILGDRKIK